MSQKVMGQTADGLRERENNDAASAGWHSENAYETSLIHVWDTARVAMFLGGYCDALVDEVQKQILETSKFRVEEWETIEPGLDEIIPFDAGKADNIVEQLKNFTLKTSFSILLYGPPGASKTTIARAVARHLERRLVYLTPSDFISAGASAIEKSTKLLFEALTALRKVVIFFDEIDRLILDRDSEAYGQQGDIFQFMTPSMLAKFNDLRKTPGAVFLIATNFAERIDRAIKREGRIDQCILCLPFNQEARTLQIKSLIIAQANKGGVNDVNLADWDGISDKAISTIAKQTGLYVYEELKRITEAAEAASGFRKNHKITWPAYRAKITKALRSGSFRASEISVRSYKKRLQNTYLFPQKPFEEYARLLLLAAESSTNGAELWIQFRDCLKNWKNLDADDYSSKRDLLKREANLYRLAGDWVNLI